MESWYIQLDLKKETTVLTGSISNCLTGMAILVLGNHS